MNITSKIITLFFGLLISSVASAICMKCIHNTLKNIVIRQLKTDMKRQIQKEEIAEVIFQHPSSNKDSKKDFYWCRSCNYLRVLDQILFWFTAGFLLLLLLLPPSSLLSFSLLWLNLSSKCKHSRRSLAPILKHLSWAFSQRNGWHQICHIFSFQCHSNILNISKALTYRRSCLHFVYVMWGMKKGCLTKN